MENATMENATMENATMENATMENATIFNDKNLFFTVSCRFDQDAICSLDFENTNGTTFSIGSIISLYYGSTHGNADPIFHMLKFFSFIEMSLSNNQFKEKANSYFHVDNGGLTLEVEQVEDSYYLRVSTDYYGYINTSWRIPFGQDIHQTRKNCNSMITFLSSVANHQRSLMKENE